MMMMIEWIVSKVACQIGGWRRMSLYRPNSIMNGVGRVDNFMIDDDGKGKPCMLTGFGDRVGVGRWSRRNDEVGISWVFFVLLLLFPCFRPLLVTSPHGVIIMTYSPSGKKERALAILLGVCRYRKALIDIAMIDEY